MKIDFVDRSAANREDNFARHQIRRERQREAAERFWSTGDNLESGEAPPYGKEWNRDYNPHPYPEAVPDAEMYDGTGVGFLYGLDSVAVKSTLRIYALSLAGWNMVREGVEVHKVQTKVDKKELVPALHWEDR